MVVSATVAVILTEPVTETPVTVPDELTVADEAPLLQVTVPEPGLLPEPRDAVVVLPQATLAQVTVTEIDFLLMVTVQDL